MLEWGSLRLMTGASRPTHFLSRKKKINSGVSTRYQSASIQKAQNPNATYSVRAETFSFSQSVTVSMSIPNVRPRQQTALSQVLNRSCVKILWTHFSLVKKVSGSSTPKSPTTSPWSCQSLEFCICGFGEPSWRRGGTFKNRPEMLCLHVLHPHCGIWPTPLTVQRNNSRAWSSDT